MSTIIEPNMLWKAYQQQNKSMMNNYPLESLAKLTFDNSTNVSTMFSNTINEMNESLIPNTPPIDNNSPCDLKLMSDMLILLSNDLQVGLGNSAGGSGGAASSDTNLTSIPSTYSTVPQQARTDTYCIPYQYPHDMLHPHSINPCN